MTGWRCFDYLRGAGALQTSPSCIALWERRNTSVPRPARLSWIVPVQLPVRGRGVLYPEQRRMIKMRASVRPHAIQVHDRKRHPPGSYSQEISRFVGQVQERLLRRAVLGRELLLRVVMHVRTHVARSLPSWSRATCRMGHDRASRPGRRPTSGRRCRCCSASPDRKSSAPR